jgi:carbon monoxide dehydrogenase subunit G
VDGTLAPRIVKYRLSPLGNDNGTLSLGGTGFVGLSVNGSIQAVGKQTQVNNDATTAIKDNFSDVGASSLRSSIRKNAYELVRGMVNNSVVNNVKYVR